MKLHFSNYREDIGVIEMLLLYWGLFIVIGFL